MYDEQINIICEKARMKRYKKPISKEFNLDAIQDTLYDISSECYDVEYLFEADDELFSDLLGGDDQLREFKFMFSDLSVSCEQMITDIKDVYLPKWFDIFFAAMSDESCSMLGWDSYENDYLGLTDRFETRMAVEEAKKKLDRFTKSDLLDGARQFFRLVCNYLSLRSRYEDLKSSMDIIRGTNRAELDVLKHINELYEKADDASDGFTRQWQKEVLDFDKLIDEIDPYSQIWLQ